MQQELRHDGHTGYVRIKLDEIWMNAVPVLTSCCIACLPCAIFRWQLSSYVFCIGMDQQNLQQGCSKHPRYKDGNLGKFVKVKWHNYSLVAIIYLEWVGEPCMKYKKHMNPAGWFRDGHFRRNISFKPMGCFPNKYYVTPRLHRPNWSPGSPGPKKDEMLPTATGGEVLACKACAMQDSCRSRCLRIDL